MTYPNFIRGEKTLSDKRFIYKIFSYLLVFLILYFLARGLFSNWQSVRSSQFTFNYFYLIVSFVLLGSAIAGFSFVWNNILRRLDSNNQISYTKAFNIYMLSEFIKYLPGTLWTILGKTHFGGKENLSKKNIIISSFFDSFFSVIPSAILGIVLTLAFFGRPFLNSNFYLCFLMILVVVCGLAFAHPKIFYPVFNFFLRKFKGLEVPPDEFLAVKDIVKVFFSYLVISFVGGLALFFFINSLTSLSPGSLFAVIGIYNLAIVAGVLAIFAPSGIGVREGILAIFLAAFLSPALAILIAVLARIWFTITEILLLVAARFLNKYKYGY